MKKTIILLTALLFALAAIALPVVADDEKKQAKKDEQRAELDAMAKEALGELFAAKADTKALYDKAAGYAVFDNMKVAFVVSGGGGQGVAVGKNGARTYMKMGTGGIGLGIGGQKYQMIFLFETAEKFDRFVDIGWQGDAGAQAAAGTAETEGRMNFHDGMAIFQMTEKGLIASADVSGTKYWKNDKLND